MADHLDLQVPVPSTGSARMWRKRSSGFHSAVSDLSRAQSGVASSYPRSFVSSTSGYRSGVTSSGSPDRGQCGPFTATSSAPDEMTTTFSLISNGDVMSQEALAPFACVSVDRPALHVWRVETGKLVTLEQNDFGFFHEGTCYLILKVYEDRSTSLHYWIGQESKQQDVHTVETQCRELDELVQRASVCSREVQGHESICFFYNFLEGLVYVEGKPKMTLSTVCKYTKRLYVIKGRKFVTAACTEPCLEALDPTACALLDGFPRMYLWIGSRCDRVSRVKAIQVARRMRNWQRKGKAHIVVVDENESTQNSAFLKKLRCGEKSSNGGSETTLPEEDNHTAILNLHRVSGNRVLYDMPFAATRPLLQRFLVTNDTYLLDQGMQTPIFFWVGAKASDPGVYDAIRRGQHFAEHRGYPAWVPVCRITEGFEPQIFKMSFLEWRDRASGKEHHTRSYSVGNIGRALFSRSDPRTVAKISELWSDDIVLSDEGSTQVFRVEGDSLDPPWDQPGVFLNSDCYVIWHRPAPKSFANPFPTSVLFYWLGSKSGCEKQTSALTLTLRMAENLEQAFVIRVLDNKEPQCFMSVFHNSIVVYDQEVQSAARDVTMYCVRECARGSMRVQQVPATSSSLHSSAAFILLTPARCILWYGKLTGGSEREFSKTMLGFLDSGRMYDYKIVTEGREPDGFWNTLGAKVPYEERYPQSIIHRRHPWLSLCCRDADGVIFKNIQDFEQKDLCESDIFIMDTFDQVYFWCGRAVKAGSRHKLLLDYLKEYMSQDRAGRKEAEVNLWVVSQDSEPEAFRRYFPCWDLHGYGGADAYNMARKSVRQENARIDIEAQMVDLTYMRVPTYPYKTLLKLLPPTGLLPDHREHHLSDKQFKWTLKQTRYDFYRLPEWKQTQILRSARLAHVPSPSETSHNTTITQKRRPSTTHC